MDDSTKKIAKKAGKILFGIAEAGASYMEGNAKSCSRNKKLPEEYRDKYADMADGFGNIKEVIHDYKTRIGQSADSSKDIEDDYYWDDYEDDDLDNIPPIDDNNYISTESKVKNYDNIDKIKQQMIEASSNDEIGSLSVDEWSTNWISLGKLSKVGSDIQEYTEVGLVRLLLNGKIVYITRAIELNNGGIRKKVQELMDITQQKKAKIFQKIKEDYEEINVEILKIGSDFVAVNISRNLENELIRKNKPEWL